MKSKVCGKCKSRLSLSEFRWRRKDNRYESYCKKCCSEYATAYVRRKMIEDKNWHNKRKKYTREHHKKCRIEALKVYSDGAMECACCGENIYEFLVIDHVNDDGNEDRRRRGTINTDTIISMLKKEGWPKGYQVLCHNCNMAKSLYGACPHSDQ